ncbi:curli biogenesis system outer membrane secretion channel CsgG [Hypnocyclicus thermotrophus]|uniref:Curli biogenesis system outer membrane secretion channel CsgG n=1 Tax=Hypnocyclicus thermotrophus TaxID=1627895 RepID=A0AA46I5W9_9FUSO|nr:CsgG/HfaB family protein [Hypnocyclicus thermotrophus]TDT71415.1 curli biogenesis system outer membrane secretion channel CsgG [Hypnocyclicus thermotrophus]
MKKIILTLMLLLTIISCSNSPTIKKEDNLTTLREYKTEKEAIVPKTKIAISTFSSAIPLAKKRNVGELLSDILSTELTQTNRFIVLERDSVDKIMQEINFSEGLGQGKIASEQNLLDADYIVTGAVTKYAVNISGKKGLVSNKKSQSIEVAFDLRLIDVRTGEVVLADVGEGSGSTNSKTTLGMGQTNSYNSSIENDALRAAVVDVLDSFVKTVDKRPWSARVAKANPREIYINAGIKSNLPIGAKLEVYEQGEAIELDGKLLGYEEKYVGTATVSDYLGDDASKCTYNGKLFHIPAIVRLKK